MAIKDNTNQTTEQQDNGASLFGSSSNGEWGLSSLGQQSGIGRYMTSESLTKTTAAIQEILNSFGNDLPKGFDLIAVQIDNQKLQNLHFSSIAFVARDVLNEDSPIAYHVLMLEGSAPRLEPTIENVQWNNQSNNVQLDRLTSDAYNQVYRNTVEQVLTQTFNLRLLNCSAQVMPFDFNLDDKDALRKLVFNVVSPVIMELLKRRPGFVDINLGKYNRDSSLYVNIGFHGKDKVDYAGNPIRDSFNIKLTGQSNQNNVDKKDINSGSKQVLVSEVSGYIEPVWMGTPPQQQYQPYGYQQQQPLQKYQARVIVTHMENMLLSTTAAQLFSLVSVAALSEGYSWFPYFNPRPLIGKKEIDWNDIGGLNLEANVYPDTANPQAPGKRVDTKAVSHTDQIQGDYLTRLFRPGLILSLDVSELGPDTFQNDIFWAAASGNAQANQMLIDAANTLTNGNFSRIIGGENVQFMKQNPERIFMGYYVNNDGLKEDIRKVDYLALMNMLGDKNPQIGEEYSNIFFNTGIPLVLRMDKWRKLLQDTLRTDITLTGHGARLTFNPDVIAALIKAVKATGVELKLNGSALGTVYQNNRATFDQSAGSVFTGNNDGLFNVGFGNNQSVFSQNLRPSSGSRW